MHLLAYGRGGHLEADKLLDFIGELMQFLKDRCEEHAERIGLRNRYCLRACCCTPCGAGACRRRRRDCTGGCYAGLCEDLRRAR